MSIIAFSAISGYSAEDGFQFGRLHLTTGLREDFTFTDNSQRTETNRKEDVLVESTPSFDMVFRPEEKVTMDVAYAFGYHDYVRNTEHDFLSHNANGLFSVRELLDGGLTISLGDIYTQSGNTNVLETELLAFTRYESNDTNLDAVYLRDRWNIAAHYDFGQLTYLSGGASNSDTSSQTGKLSEHYALAGPFDIFAEENIQQIFQTGTLDQDIETFVTGFGFTSPRLNSTVSAGYSTSQIFHKGTSESGPVASGRVSYKILPRLAVSVDLGYGITRDVRLGRVLGIEPTGNLRGGGGNNVSFGTQIQYKVTDHIDLAFDANRTTNTGLLQTTTDTFTGMTAAFVLSDRVHLLLNVFRDLSVDDTGATPQATTISFRSGLDYRISHHLSATWQIERDDRRGGDNPLVVNQTTLSFLLKW